MDAALLALLLVFGQVPAAAEPAGAWRGRWIADGAPGRGAVEVIFSPADGGAVVGQFTFLGAGPSRTVRYEGHRVDGTVEFKVPDGGAIVLTLPAPDRMTGTFSGLRLPAAQGRLELEPAR